MKGLVDPEQEQQEEPGAGVPAGSSASHGDPEVVGKRVLASLIDCPLVALLSSAVFAPLLFVPPGLVLVLVLLLLLVLHVLRLLCGLRLRVQRILGPDAWEGDL